MGYNKQNFTPGQTLLAEHLNKIEDGIIANANNIADNMDRFVNYYVTPEMYGAKGDGETDDTVAFQEALDSGQPVCAHQTYSVSSIFVKDTELLITGEINGQVVINNNATVHGGKIKQNTDNACVLFESKLAEGQGYMNSFLFNTRIIPTREGVGIELLGDDNALFGVNIQNVDIASCGKSIYINNKDKWITKCSFENIFCHTPSYAIFIENHKITNTSCGDFTFRNVYAQYWKQKPINFFNLDTGNCLATLYDSFCYDGIGEYHYYLNDSVSDTRIQIVGIKTDYATEKFTNKQSLKHFYFQGQYVNDPLYIKAGARKDLPLDNYGSVYFEHMSKPALDGSRFFGFVTRCGVNSGQKHKVAGISCYDGRLAVLKSEDGTLNSENVNVVEVSSPYSGAIYTTDKLPTSVRDGATCWCSDIKMAVTHFKGSWYKPDGSALTLGGTT